MTSPFQFPQPKAGPMITPRTMNAAGQGGQQNPPYLQTRTAQGPGQPSQPVITPKPSAVGDTVNPAAQQPQAQAQTPLAPPGPPQAAGAGSGQAPNLNDVYGFFKSDLQNQTNQALANAKADASARGVYYGTPLTGSEADINTQYLRGLGQLQSGMYGNEMQRDLATKGLQSSLLWQGGLNAPPMPGQMDFSGLGALLGGSQDVSGQRSGPMGQPIPGAGATITPKNPLITPMSPTQAKTVS